MANDTNPTCQFCEAQATWNTQVSPKEGAIYLCNFHFRELFPEKVAEMQRKEKSNA